MLPTQVVGMGQTLPQAPQLLLSNCVFTSQPSPSNPLQLLYPMLQNAIAHCAMLQAGNAFGSTHCKPQLPQLFTSVKRLVSQPSPGNPLQLDCPGAQVHWPPTHTVEATQSESLAQPPPSGH